MSSATVNTRNTQKLTLMDQKLSGVGSAAVSGKSITTTSLVLEVSILSAELYAIKMTITKIKLKVPHIS